jgi:hypothetical protein
VDETDFATTVYGSFKRGGELGDFVRKYAPTVPDGTLEPTAPNQLIGIEYFGAVPADYLTEADRAEIEAYPHQTDAALHRYALVVAKGIERRMLETGATHVNVICHSMGCHIARYMIENDIEGLASASKLVRWGTVAGVICGARLARLYDNERVREVGDTLGFNAVDFVHMNPDYVTDHSAVWDHKLHEGNNPLFSGMLIHHVVATNPVIDNLVLPVVLIDLYNPVDEPNDSIVFTEDEYFHAQSDAAGFQTPSGVRLTSTRTSLNLAHEVIRDDERAGLLVAAAITGSRKVFVTLRSITLLVDHEKDGSLDFSEEGLPPAELVAESTVRFNPYLEDTFATDIVAHEQLLVNRTLSIVSMSEGDTVAVDYSLFSGPVFDAMTSMQLEMRLLEVDTYPRYDLDEALVSGSEVLLAETLDLPLSNHTTTVANGDVSALVEVRIESLF